MLKSLIRYVQPYYMLKSLIRYVQPYYMLKSLIRYLKSLIRYVLHLNVKAGVSHLSFQGFFEEVEDLKYALQQSARLNSAYEKALRKLCSQFGVPLPSVTGTTPRQQKRRAREREFR